VQSHVDGHFGVRAGEPTGLGGLMEGSGRRECGACSEDDASDEIGVFGDSVLPFERGEARREVVRGGGDAAARRER
jgi:hypothetical protein